MSSRNTPNPRIPLVVVAAALSFASGAADITSFTRLGMVFSSVMTGNLVILGLAIESASGTLAVHTAAAIASYILGVALGSLVCRDAGRGGSLWGPRVTATLAVELVAFVGFTIGWEITDGDPTGVYQLVVLGFTAVAMGLQSAAVRNVGATLSTTYLTGTLTSAVASLVTRSAADRNSRLNLAVLGSVTVGAAAGGGIIRAAPSALPALPLLAVAGVVVVAATVGVHE